MNTNQQIEARRRAGQRGALLIQLVATVAILAWVPTSIAKTAALAACWVVTFRRIDAKELLLYVGVCCFFTVMNAMSLKRGIFHFEDPDILGMPLYELFMWGFYVLHTKRMLGDQAPPPSRLAWFLAIAYSIAFATLTDPTQLLVGTSILLILALLWFHTPRDFAYLGYMVLLGAVVEYTGVASGQWAYPEPPVGGVPPWFVTLWGGVGLFFHRLILPLMYGNRGAAAPVIRASH